MSAVTGDGGSDGPDVRRGAGRGAGGNSVNGGSQHGLVQAGEIGTYTQHLHFHGHGAGDASGPPGSPGSPPSHSSPSPMGHQLPLDNDVFENRDLDRGKVWEALDERQRSPRPVRPLTAVISGVGGIGKTALAVRLSHELKSRFTAAYVDLDEWRTAGSIDLQALLKHLLRWLGAEESWLTADYREQVRLYERKTHGARVALVIDNVWSADEISTLLPVSAESVVLVVSQERLRPLEARGAISIALDPLAEEHASAVLHKIVAGAERDVPPRVLEQLARLCAGFPIALHAAGRLLCEHPSRRTERIVADLTKDLYEKGLSVVEAVWNAAYDALSVPAAQRLYRLLPQHPGYDIALEAATALLGTGLDDAEDALDALTDAGLLALSPRPGRNQLHDLLRAHATRCANRHTDPAETEEGLRRLLVWYRRQAERADRAIDPRRPRVAEPVPEPSDAPERSAAPGLPDAPDVPFASAAEARTWLDTERKALYGLVRTASDLGEDTHAWSLCEPLWKHYEDHHNHTDAIRAFQVGKDAAQRAGAVRALIRMRCQLAQAQWKAGRAGDADTETQQAVRSAESVVPGERLHASALEFRGKYFAWNGEPDRAVEYFERSRAIHRTIENAYGILLQSFLLGRTLRAAGRLPEAETELTTALGLAREQEHERMIGRSAAELGRTHRELARPEQAIAVYEEALAQEQARGSTYDQTQLHEELAALIEATGDTESAESHRARARELRIEAGVGPGVEIGT
ncbi:tetratricopeptide repeat protein [Streptomyces sp. NPDC088116]|uniref:tetratricopeptide repeat protein n=1 Tax=Streptomyces sp. NPDC088116 TaxID=3365825 RepID=UPI003811FE25